MNPPRAVVVGLEGPEPSAVECRLLAHARPLGVILFKRNVESRAQLARLTAAVRAALGRDDAPILVDQEGGRVQRLGSPHWPAWPPARRVGALAERDRAAGVEAARILATRMALDLREVGIDWVCAPVLDLALAETHAAIGDRAYAGDPDLVAELGAAAVAGFLAGGVVPIVKHVPGHGRARVDPHRALPTVDAPLATLEAADFGPFRALAAAPAAMTAHVVYDALDRRRPASCSPTVVGETVRGRLGLEGLLVSDDVDMGALAGGVDERVAAVLAAGNDVALQCNGIRADLERALAAAPPLGDAALARVAAARRQAVEAAADVADRRVLDAALATSLG
ncbi:MAG: beta-N-acetylhexosaminidase [Alphaproteobacteria bacterium]|jgi:beta-N-acetylhexosaminidase|nr:beta-N-acetylhexosaminidase [Alphaproteobacteria bacterium]